MKLPTYLHLDHESVELKLHAALHLRGVVLRKRGSFILFNVCNCNIDSLVSNYVKVSSKMSTRTKRRRQLFFVLGLKKWRKAGLLEIMYRNVVKSAMAIVPLREVD